MNATVPVLTVEEVLQDRLDIQRKLDAMVWLVEQVNAEMRTIRYLTRASPLMLSRASIEDRNVKLAACLDRIWALMPDKEEKC